MPLEMRLSDYILRFPGDVKESPNPYNQRKPEFHGILEGQQRRGHPQRRRGNIWNVLREQWIILWDASLEAADTISSGMTVLKVLKINVSRYMDIPIDLLNTRPSQHSGFLHPLCSLCPRGSHLPHQRSVQNHSPSLLQLPQAFPLVLPVPLKKGRWNRKGNPNYKQQSEKIMKQRKPLGTGS